jgi:response regulator NasT
MTRAVISNTGLSQKERALLIDPLDSRAALLRRALRENAYPIIETVTDACLMLEKAEEHQPDILVVGMDLPDEDTLQQLVELRERMPLPVIVFSEKDAPPLVQKVVKAGVSAFIVDDIQPQRLPSIINIAVARFHEQQGLIKELNTAKTKLAERKTLEKAKGLLMKQKGLSEDEAYTSLRKLAMDKGQPIVKVAESIIDVFSLLGDVE